MMLLSRDKKSEKNVSIGGMRLELLDDTDGLSKRSGTCGRFAYVARGNQDDRPPGACGAMA